MGSPCARAISGKPSCAAPAAAAADWMNRLRLNVMVPSSSGLALLCLNHGISRLRRQAGRLGEAELAAYEVRAEHDRDHLVERVAPAHALAAHAAVRRKHQALGRNVCERLAHEAGHLLRRLDLQRV